MDGTNGLKEITLTVNVFTAPGKVMVGERPKPFGEAFGFDPLTSTLVFGEYDAVLVDAMTIRTCPLNNGSGAIPALGLGTLIPDPRGDQNRDHRHTGGRISSARRFGTLSDWRNRLRYGTGKSAFSTSMCSEIL
jgi:hypothetical protein